MRQFRAILGSGYTHQMEVMLADIQKQNALSASCGQIDFTGRILTMGSWPKSLQDSEKALIVPPIINDGLNIIETSYKNATAGRKIMWIHSAANCIIYGTLERRGQLSLLIWVIQENVFDHSQICMCPVSKL